MRRQTLQRQDPVIQSLSSTINRKAFTLIELLVVIAIIALLMAFLFPALNRARNQARAVSCQANLRQWGVALYLYTQDSMGRLPKHGILLLRGAPMPGTVTDIADREDTYHGFHTKAIALCPAATRLFSWPENETGHGFGGVTTVDGVSILKYEGILGATFNAWKITLPEPPFSGSYGCNQWLFTNFRGDKITPKDPTMDVLATKGRSDVPVLLDSSSPFSKPEDEFGAPWVSSFGINRHMARVNGLFLDWSARPVGLKELWTLKWSMAFNRANKWTLAGGVKPEDWPDAAWRSYKDY